MAAVWGAFALWYQVPGGYAFKTLAVALWTALGLAMLIALWQGRIALGLLGFAAAFAILLTWWHQLRPSNGFIWADDVAQMTTGTVEGNRVTLHNVRNFDWRSDSDYTQRWETRCYALDQLNSVDMIMSYWTGPAIAHMLVSFGFDDADHVAFSVEIRRRRGQSFSEIGDYLYRIRMPIAAMRSLFLAYIDQANRLVDTPHFYNTVTVNCTTLVYHMMERIVGYLPWDYRLLLSGYLPQYVYGIGGLAPHYSLEELRQRGRITERAKDADQSESFSADIRRDVPRIEATQFGVTL